MATIEERVIEEIAELRAELRAHVNQVLAWQRRHDAAHLDRLDRQHDDQIELEGRLTRVESAVSVRSWLGGLGVLVSWVLSAVGIAGGKPS